MNAVESGQEKGNHHITTKDTKDHEGNTTDARDYFS